MTAAPTSLDGAERSRTLTVWPARRRAMAVERPAMPPPTMRMVSEGGGDIDARRSSCMIWETVDTRAKAG
jgi:hypothetical protein